MKRAITQLRIRFQLRVLILRTNITINTQLFNLFHLFPNKVRVNQVILTLMAAVLRSMLATALCQIQNLTEVFDECFELVKVIHIYFLAILFNRIFPIFNTSNNAAIILQLMLKLLPKIRHIN